MLNSVTEVFLVRHGLTNWNQEKRTQGNMDQPLNATGHAQAQRLMPALMAHHRQRPFDAIISSDLSRAVATVEPTALALGMALQLDSGWRERHFGVLEGLTQDQMQQQHPKDFEGWRSADPNFVLNQGESLQQLVGRIGARFDHLVQSYLGKRVLVMTHGGSIDAVARHLQFVTIDAARGYSIPNTCISWLKTDSTPAAKPDWQQVLWTDASHLAPPI